DATLPCAGESMIFGWKMFKKQRAETGVPGYRMVVAGASSGTGRTRDGGWRSLRVTAVAVTRTNRFLSNGMRAAVSAQTEVDVASEENEPNVSGNCDLNRRDFVKTAG